MPEVAAGVPLPWIEEKGSRADQSTSNASPIMTPERQKLKERIHAYGLDQFFSNDRTIKKIIIYDVMTRGCSVFIYSCKKLQP